MDSNLLSPAAIALNRFGLGARPDENPPTNPERFLKAQFERYEPTPNEFAQLPDAGILVQANREQQREMRAIARFQPQTAVPSNAERGDAPRRLAQLELDRKELRSDVDASYRQAAQARMTSALRTDAPFVERMVHFWSNHFCISADNLEVKALAGAFERDAIRPHVLGRFEDMVFAVEQHPAMLIYLNQTQSIGPNSLAAQRIEKKEGRRRGINENLAREIMELHTLGVRSGYNQADVVEFARAMTGWSVKGLDERSTGGGNDGMAFRFHPQTHEPGIRTIMGRTYQQQDAGQARAVLSDLASAPQTASHIATKLARHFAGDTPPAELVGRLAATFSKSGGNLQALYSTLIESPETWAPAPSKFKTPWEWTVSALRGLGHADLGKMKVETILEQLGQPLWKPGSPAGWDDIAASWAASNALLRRVEMAQLFATQHAASVDARALALQLFPSSLSPATSVQLARAESPATALALLLASPDFLRR